MTPSSHTWQQRGRLDHLLPQGYLDGFTNPSRPGDLSVYDIKKQRWFESGTSHVAAIKGFYDYSNGSMPDQTADQVFKEFEDTFPNLRRKLIAVDFSDWKAHLGFLLRFAQMLRTRSELFRQHSLADIRTRPMVRVKDFFTDPATGNTKIRYEELTEMAEERESLFRNMSITKMRTEIMKGEGELSELHWCVRLTTDYFNPVITADNPLILSGKTPKIEDALHDPKNLFFFPLCWQACLIGSRAKFDVETECFHPSDLRTLQLQYLCADCRFAYSPVRLAI